MRNMFILQKEESKKIKELKTITFMFFKVQSVKPKELPKKESLSNP